MTRSTAASTGVVVVAALLLSACAPASGPGIPSVYRGTSHGVAMTLKIRKLTGSGSAATLAVHFDAGGDPVRRRALQANHLYAFCVWLLKNGDASNVLDIRLDPHRRTQTFVASTGGNPSSGDYTCGLTAHGGAITEEPPWRNYLRRAIVAVRLTRSAHG
jgi:hypothetical protein